MPSLFDTSLYISALRKGGDTALLLRRWAQGSPLWLSSVVLEELYAGAHPKDWQILEKLEGDFHRAKRLLTPNFTDWTHAGKILYRLAQKHGFERIGRARLTNDALIVTSAARAGITVLTANRRDFARLAEFCPVQWQEQTVQSE
jgi:predicted nucleic acid-binding protein